MKLIDSPITGQEIPQTDSAPHAALVHFYTAFNHRNFDRMKLNWLQSEQASMSNPLGGIKRGWSEIKEVYKRIFSGPATVYVEFYDYSIHSTDTMFLAVGRERGSLDINNERIELAIRTTRIFTYAGNEWKQIHHHGSMDNPELLTRYQNALLNK